VRAASPIYRWRVGEVEIARVLEFEAALFEPTVLYPEASSEIIRRHRNWLEPMLLDRTNGQLVFSFHSTIIKTPRATILVDTCSGNDKERPRKLRYHKKLALSCEFSRGRLCSRRHRLCAMYASARRSRRLEYASSRRSMGADIPKRPLPVRAPGVGALAGS
jgi:hypothetical protein